MSTVTPAVQQFISMAQDHVYAFNDSRISDSTVVSPDYSSITARSVQREFRARRTADNPIVPTNVSDTSGDSVARLRDELTRQMKEWQRSMQQEISRALGQQANSIVQPPHVSPLLPTTHPINAPSQLNSAAQPPYVALIPPATYPVNSQQTANSVVQPPYVPPVPSPRHPIDAQPQRSVEPNNIAGARLFPPTSIHIPAPDPITAPMARPGYVWKEVPQPAPVQQSFWNFSSPAPTFDNQPTGSHNGHVLNNHTRIDLSKWGIKFDGTLKSMSAEDFIFRVDVLRRDHGCSFHELIRSFHLLLEGPALDWYWNVRKLTPMLTWEDLELAFLR